MRPSWRRSVDFCEATTSKVHAVLQHVPSDLRGGTFLQHPRVLVATVGNQEKPHLSMQTLHAAVFQASRGAYTLLRLLSVTENQETQWLLDEIQRQPSVFVLSGPATVITNIAAASAVLGDFFSAENDQRRDNVRLFSGLRAVVTTQQLTVRDRE